MMWGEKYYNPGTPLNQMAGGVSKSVTGKEVGKKGTLIRVIQ